MHRFTDAGPIDRLGIYINDHRGLLAAEHDLARRCHASNSEPLDDPLDGSGTDDGDLVTLLAAVISQNIDDRERLDALLDVLGVRANPIKTIGARIGERLGRLKLNGQLRGYSPLSRVIEIEALLASTAVRQAMWESISAGLFDSDSRDDAVRRAEIVGDHHEKLTAQHTSATDLAFATAVSTPD